MSNPLFQALGGAPQVPPIVQQFQQFRATFKGDPQQTVMQFLQSGKISQAQLNQVQHMAQQFRHLLG